MAKNYPPCYRLFYAEILYDEITDVDKTVFDFARGEGESNLLAHIKNNGLQSPVYANLRKGELRIRRGNNRVRCLKELGWKRVPAFIVDYDFVPKEPPEHWELLEHDQAALQERFFSKGNCVLQLQRRTASVVTPHMPRTERGRAYAER